MIIQAIHNGEVLAIIIRNNHPFRGIDFVTPNTYSQQLATMEHPAGKEIPAHFHNHTPREVHLTQETLVVRKGRLRVDLYTSAQEYVESYELVAGDVILLVSGGHGFKVLEELEMIEIKQGPYVGDIDKTRFEGATESTIKVIHG